MTSATHLYVIEMQGYHKIGVTTDIQRRLREFEVPFDIVVLHLIALSYPHECERILHKCFAAQRIKGEWFVLNNADLFLIRSLRAIADFRALDEPHYPSLGRKWWCRRLWYAD